MSSPARSGSRWLDRVRPSRAGAGASGRDPDRPAELVRDLGAWGTASVVVGVIIGTGIYLIPSEMARVAGSLELVLGAWLVAGILSLLGALTYAELASALPESGGDYVYLRRAFGPLWGFLYGWRGILVSMPASLAAYGAGIMLFASYLWPAAATPIGGWDFPVPFREAPARFELRWSQLMAAGIIIIVAAINYLRVRHVGRLQIVLTAIKTLGLAGVIGVGLWSVLAGPGPAAGAESPVEVTVRAPGVGGFLAAVTAALWAFSGWQQVVRLGGEVRNPGRSFPRAIIGGFLFTAGLFMAANLAYFAVLSFQEVAGSRHVATDMLQRAVGSNVAGWFTLLMIVSVLGTMNANILSASRIPYALARDGLFFSGLARVHPERRVPGAAVTLTSAMGVVLVLTGGFEDMAALSVFASWTFYALSAAALFRLRRMEPDLPRPYRAWGYPVVPALFCGLAALLAVSIFIQRPGRSGIGLAVVMLGIPMYHYWSRRRS